jgi:hypothetical protein
VAWSTPDLSSITVELIALIQNAIVASPIPPFNVHVSGSMPETVRKAGHCQLSLYLLHVGRDPYWRNTPRDNPRALVNPQQALSLNLTYLLTAYADADFVAEQQAMSIALHAIHEQPLFHTPTEEFTVSIEADTIDEMSRLWQAIAVPIRLSSVIKVGVVFISPSQPPATVAPPPRRANIVVGADLDSADVPQLFDVATHIDFTVPPPPQPVTVQTRPSLLTGGDTVLTGGSGLDLPSASDVYLGRFPGGPVWRVTSWRQPPVSPNEFVLALPSAYMAPGSPVPAPPTVMPPPGVYQIAVGDAAAANAATAIPVAIAARLSGVANPPLLTPDATGLYTVTGEGLFPGATALAMDTVGLALAAASNPAPGFFFVDAAGQTITFRRPALQTGRYYLRIRVSGVECPPAWYVDVP